jgi:hypothetical protein
MNNIEHIIFPQLKVGSIVEVTNSFGMKCNFLARLIKIHVAQQDEKDVLFYTVEFLHSGQITTINLEDINKVIS